MATYNPAKQAAIDGLYSTFRNLGYDGATLVELSRATGLGKASLYYHFPQGKQEMATELLRNSVAQLNQLAFKHLRKKKKTPAIRISKFLTGFSDYVSQGEQNCLAVILVMGAAREQFQTAIKQQTEAWLAELTDAFSDSGLSDKKARRRAVELMTSLYGALILARMLDDAKIFQQIVERLEKAIQDE